MKVAQTTEASADALAAIVDKAYGYPSRPATMRDGSPLHPSVPRAWDGTGRTPFGWTKRQVEVWVRAANDAWVTLDDVSLATALASGALTPGERAQLTSGSSVRPDVADLSQGGTRSPKARAADEAAKETKP